LQFFEVINNCWAKHWSDEVMQMFCQFIIMWLTRRKRGGRSFDGHLVVIQWSFNGHSMVIQ